MQRDLDFNAQDNPCRSTALLLRLSLLFLCCLREARMGASKPNDVLASRVVGDLDSTHTVSYTHLTLPTNREV